MQRRGSKRIETGLLAHAIDDTTHAATTEEHTVRTLEGLDPLDVVQVAVVLDVIAQAVDEQISRSAAAAEHRVVAIAFTLRDADPRHVAHHVGEVLHVLVIDQLARHHRDGGGLVT